MIKKIVLCVLALWSANVFATPAYSFISTTELPAIATKAMCQQATATDDLGFCSSFKSIAQCHCTSTGLPDGMCRDMSVIYSRMISLFGSVEKACDYQEKIMPDHTSKQNCIDDWTCYRTGGTDSAGRLCNASGRSC